VALLLSVAGPSLAQTASSVGRPSAVALASARSKQNAMRQPKGPDSVTLSPDEAASLIESGLDPQARKVLDSIQVRLEPGRIALHASIVTSALDSILGPLAAMLGPREPIRVAGPVHATKPGLITWEPDNFSVRSFALPQAAIPHLINQLTGATDGTVPIAVPPSVQRVNIQSAGVTFSRRAS